MDLTNVPSGTPASVVQTLENHLSVADSILARDKRLLPMLMTQGSRKKDNNLFQLRPQRGNDDEHKLLKRRRVCCGISIMKSPCSHTVHKSCRMDLPRQML